MPIIALLGYPRTLERYTSVSYDLLSVTPPEVLSIAETVGEYTGTAAGSSVRRGLTSAAWESYLVVPSAYPADVTAHS